MNVLTERTEKTVLIVDPTEETRDVLATVLERRGVRTKSTSTLRRGAALARENRPDLIVFDVETIDADPEQAFESFVRKAKLTDANVPIVAIGSAKLEAPEGANEFVAKPFHYGPLLKKIEELLDSLERRASETK